MFTSVFLLNIVYFSVCLTSNKLYWIENQLADISTQFYTSASWTVGKLTVIRHYGCVLSSSGKTGRFIKWPLTHDECAKIKNKFYIHRGFPGIVGCVDRTHVRLQAPTQNENNYVNRKGFHSINVQAVCSHAGE